MKYLFTSTPSPQRQTTSDIFMTFRNPGQVPGPVGHSGIIPLTGTLPLASSIIRAHFGAFISSMLKKTIPVDGHCDALLANSLSTDYFSPPDIVTSFPGKVTESTQAKMLEIGFTQQSASSRTYFKGPASIQNADIIVSCGGSIDTQAPYGSASIRGYFAFSAVQKLILSSINILKAPLKQEAPAYFKLPSGQFDPCLSSYKIRHKDSSTIKGRDLYLASI